MRSFGLFGELPKRRWHRLARHIALYLRSASGSSWDLFIWESPKSPGGSPGGSPVATDFLIRFVPSPGLQRRTHPGTVEFQMSGCQMLPICPLHSQVTKLSLKACSLEKYRNVAYLLHICAPRYLALGRFYTGPKSFKLLLYIISFHWNILQVQTSRSSSYIKLRRTGSVPIDLLFLPTLWLACYRELQPASLSFMEFQG